MAEKKYALLPADDAVQNWFEENIDKDCSASSAIYKFRLWLEALQANGESPAEQPVTWISADTKPEHNIGVLVFIPGEDNHITSGMWDISNEWVLLDEYRTPEEEVSHWMSLPAFPEGYTWNEIPDDLVDTIKKIAKEELVKRPVKAAQPVREVEFAEWLRNEGWEGKKHVGWINHNHAPDEQGSRKFMTTAQLYNLFKEQKAK